MVEIRYDDKYEVADMAGLTVSEAREQFRAEFGIPDKARAKLNGSKVKGSLEPDTVLNGDDKLSFAVAKSRGAYMVSALLLALAITGSVFAYGFVNATTTLNASTAESNFAEVLVNNSYSGDAWEGFGYYKGSIPVGSLFDIQPADGYTGDLVVSVTIGNADQLAKRYRVLAIQLQLVDSDNPSQVLDINEDNAGNEGDANDWVMLTLNNGTVDMFPDGGANMTVRVKGGFYITHVFPGSWEGSASPDLYCEVAQR